MSPYIDLKKERCSSCEKDAEAKVVLMPNGFVIRACAEHLIDLGKIMIAQKEGTLAD